MILVDNMLYFSYHLFNDNDVVKNDAKGLNLIVA